MGFQSQTNVSQGRFEDPTLSLQRALSGIRGGIDQRLSQQAQREQQQSLIANRNSREDRLLQEKLGRANAKSQVTKDILTSDVSLGGGQTIIDGQIVSDGTRTVGLDAAQQFGQAKLSEAIDRLYAPGQKAYDATYQEAKANNVDEQTAIKLANDAQNSLNAKAGLAPGAVGDNLTGTALVDNLSAPTAKQINDERIRRATDAADVDALAILKEQQSQLGTDSKANTSIQRAELEKFKAGSSLLRAQFNASKGLGTGAKGKNSFNSIGKAKLAGLEASELVDNEYWFGHRDEAERVLAAAVIMGLDDKQQLALLNQGNPANKNILDFRDRFDSKLVESFLGKDKAALLEGYQKGTLSYDKFIAGVKELDGGSAQSNSNLQGYIDDSNVKQKALEDRLQLSLSSGSDVGRLDGTADAISARLQASFGQPGKQAPITQIAGAPVLPVPDVPTPLQTTVANQSAPVRELGLSELGTSVAANALDPNFVAPSTASTSAPVPETFSGTKFESFGTKSEEYTQYLADKKEQDDMLKTLRKGLVKTKQPGRSLGASILTDPETGDVVTNEDLLARAVAALNPVEAAPLGAPSPLVAANTPVTPPADAPINVRNFNPGNLRASSLSSGNNGGFSTFDTPEEGVAALARDIGLKITGDSSSGKKDTINDFIEVYAPPSENDTEAYANFLEKETGITRDTKLTLDDIDSLVRAITLFEGGAVTAETFTDDVFSRGLKLYQDSK